VNWDIDQEYVLRLSRRELIKCSVYGAAGVFLANGLSSRALGEYVPQTSSPIKGAAKSVIQIWLSGGPSHLDTFDPKPGAGPDYAGPFMNPIKTNQGGITINELLPLLGKQADKFSLINSMTHHNNGHETAAYMMQTGFPNGDGITHPGIGAVTSFMKGRSAGYKGLIPPYIVLTQLLGRFSEAGFLGDKAAPFATGGNPAAARFLVEGVVAEGISDERQQDRRTLLQDLDTLRASLRDDPQFAALGKCETEAYDLILGNAGKVFDLSQEKDDLRTRYGRSTFGQSCLLARRLVERGAPYVAINYGGWDTHKQNFPAMHHLLPELDKGLATLLQDLSDHGLLDSTIVWCCGEFGRTPKIDWGEPWEGGRGHWGNVFSCLVAGGGFKGGHVVGSSDEKGEEVANRPVYPSDLIGSLLALMGIDLSVTLPHPQGYAVPIIPSAWSGGKSAGRLTEIM
jgi:hypothetical protein